MKRMNIFLTVATHIAVVKCIIIIMFIYIVDTAFVPMGNYHTGQVHPGLSAAYASGFWNKQIIALFIFGLPLTWIVWICLRRWACKTSRIPKSIVNLVFFWILLNAYFFARAASIFSSLIHGMWNNNLERVLRGRLSPLWPSEEAAHGTEVQHLADTLSWFEKIYVLPLAKLFTLGWKEEAYLLFAFVWGTVTFLLVMALFKIAQFLWKRVLQVVRTNPYIGKTQED